jgi:hypothetical protein
MWYYDVSLGFIKLYITKLLSLRLFPVEKLTLTVSGVEALLHLLQGHLLASDLEAISNHFLSLHFLMKTGVMVSVRFLLV